MAEQVLRAKRKINVKVRDGHLPGTLLVPESGFGGFQAW